MQGRGHGETTTLRLGWSSVVTCYCKKQIRSFAWQQRLVLPWLRTWLSQRSVWWWRQAPWQWGTRCSCFLHADAWTCPARSDWKLEGNCKDIDFIRLAFKVSKDQSGHTLVFRDFLFSDYFRKIKNKLQTLPPPATFFPHICFPALLKRSSHSSNPKRLKLPATYLIPWFKFNHKGAYEASTCTFFFGIFTSALWTFKPLTTNLCWLDQHSWRCFISPLLPAPPDRPAYPGGGPEVWCC